MSYRLVGLLLCLMLVAFSTLACAAPVVTFYSFPFDKSPGLGGEDWTMSGGEWQYGAPGGLGGDPASAHTGSYVYGYDIANDGLYAPSIASPYYLRTTALNCTGFKNVTLRFWRWLGVESSAWDHVAISVSNDGSAWTTVWANGIGVFDSEWTQVSYDISDVADGQPTVYIQWEMGPTDPDFQYCGWNIDDVELTGTPATEILAWVPYTDMLVGGEYDNTLAALDTYYTSYNLTDSTTTDPASLADELKGKHVMLVMEQENATSEQLEELGADLSDVLFDFAESGGTIVVLLEGSWIPPVEGFLNASGLLTGSTVTMSWGGETLTVVQPGHPLGAGMPATFTAENATASYSFGPEADVVVEDGDGNAVEAFRRIGAGAVVFLGFDYYEYSSSTALLLANAVACQGLVPDVLLYESSPRLHVGAEALNRLNLSFNTADDSDFNSMLALEDWNLVIADAPGSMPIETGNWQPFIDWVGAGGHALLSTWDLAGASYAPRVDLASAFGVSSSANLDTVPTVYDWDAGPPAFDLREQVPATISGWTDIYWDVGVDANRLTVTDPDAVALAGFAVDPTADEASIVLGNDGRTLIDGFLWDDRNQDTDDDGVQDATELVMNQVLMLLSVPLAGISADPVEAVVGDTITFEDASLGPVNSWSWLFGDGETSSLQDATHVYSEAGIYTVRLKATNSNGDGWAVEPRLVWIGFPDVPPDNWAFHEVLECVDAGVVQGYDEVTYDPTGVVNRAQMAAYMARTLAGGEAAVPDGPATATFDDVPTDYWAYKYVEFCKDNDIVQGYDAVTYAPEDAVNRGQMAVYVARSVAGGETAVPDGPATATFNDVPTDYWAFKHVEYCFDNGIVQGYDATTYSPEVEVTRDQMAVYVARTLPLL